MKSKVLHIIYETVAGWSHDLPIACGPTCSCCCTQNVTITALEGEQILRFLMAKGLSDWFADSLAAGRKHRPATITTNEFALACLEGRETETGAAFPSSPCPFLLENLCRIYPVRPFGCRLFASTQKCSATQPAVVADYYFEAATAVTQLVEHLGQREYWGNMLDVLPALLDIGEFHEIARHLPPALSIEARLRTLTAKPLPGFLLSEENAEKVSSLLEALFSARVDGKTVEDILNGK